MELLKVTVGKMAVSCLSDEISRYGKFEHKDLSKLNASQLHPDRECGGLVSVPVGSKPDLKKPHVLDAAKATLKIF